VLIDGQQRITALTAAVVGKRVLNKNYKEVAINIAYNPITETFDVLNKAYEKSPVWINSVNPVINDEISISKARRAYIQLNPDADEDLVEDRLEKLKQIKNRQIGIIELDHALDIDTVTEIFIRINQKGVVLSNADFVMSKIAADEQHGGNILRKVIDYFCRLIVDKGFNKHILDNDKDFSNSNYYSTLKWMASGHDDLYVPDYVDMLRVSFTYQFHRGKFSDLVALLSGRNFETRKFEDQIAESSYQKLADGLTEFVNQTNYQRFLMLIQSAGFIHQKLISSKNSLNFAYVLYLKLRKQDAMADPAIQHFVTRWLVMSLLTGRYSGSSESYIDDDIKQIAEKGIEAYLQHMEQTHLGEGFWSYGLVNDLETSSTNNNAYNVYLAAQCYHKTNSFLSQSMTISSLVEQRGDVHHLFPKSYLEQNHYKTKDYNQVANYVYIEQATNIKIGNLAPRLYMNKVQAQIDASELDITSLTSQKSLANNLADNDIPDILISAEHQNYNDFLQARRQLMAKKIKAYYEQL